jgi:DNA-binding protein H-NS
LGRKADFFYIQFMEPASAVRYVTAGRFITRIKVQKKRNAPENLAGMSIDDLLSMRNRIDQIIAGRVDAEKRSLNARLDALKRFEMASSESRFAHRNGSRHDSKRVLPPKYRHPKTGETWAGRGLQPKWLRKAVDAGHDPSEFRV